MLQEQLVRLAQRGTLDTRVILVLQDTLVKQVHLEQRVRLVQLVTLDTQVLRATLV